MTTDFRALCKELTDALAEWELGGSPPEDTADADLVARARAGLAAEPEGPTGQDIEALHHAVFSSRLQGPPPNTSFEVDFVRAVLARWGQAPNA
jgi:hypothetical protein